MDSEGSSFVLLLDRVSDIDELAVLKDQEVMLLSESSQSLDGVGIEVGDNVYVSF